MRALFATGLLVLLGCSLPSNVLFKCEKNGSCALPGLTCAADGYCHPPGDEVDAGACVPGELTTVCAAAECGFVVDGCGVEHDCERLCPAPQECGLQEPNRCSLPSLCTPEGWCWENPLPQGFTLNASLRLDARHTWFVGENRVVMFFDGERNRLQEVPAPPGVELLGIHGTAVDDVFIVGNNGVTLHFDGTRWEREGTLSGFNNQLRTVWSFGDGGALAAGPGGKLLSRAALVDPFSRWTLETFPSAEEITEVFSDPAGTIYAVTRRNELFTRAPESASGWTRLDTVPLQDTLAGMAREGGLTFGGSSSTRATLVHREPDGGWRELTDAGFTTYAFVPGDGGVFVLSNGADFGWLDDGDELTRFTVQPGTWNTAATLPGPRLLLAGHTGSMAIVDLDGGLSWRSTPRVQRGHSLNAVCGSSPEAMFAVGGIDNGSSCSTCKVRWLERAVSSAGAQWMWKDFQLGGTTQLLACFAEGPDKVWLTSDDSKFLFQDAGQWGEGDFGGSVSGRYSGAWGGGDAGYFFTRRESAEVTTSFDGVSGFVPLNVGAAGNLRSVWGLGGDDVFVVGVNGTTSRFDGLAWKAETSVAQTEFEGVHGARLIDGGQRYVAVGSRGVLYSLDGDAGAVTEVSSEVEFKAAWVSSRGTAWAVGRASDGGAFAMRGGVDGGWSLLPLTSPRALTGVFGFDQTDGGVSVWVTGPAGMILRKDH